MKNLQSPQMIMIEDEHDDAKDYIKHLDIEELISQIAYITDFNMLSNFILEENPNSVFWVDINLGVGREKDGLRMIEIIKDKCPEALIIVHSAYMGYKEDCIARGAHHFFAKAGGHQYEETLAEIRTIIESFLSSKGIEIKTTEYYAQVAHIQEDESWVKLEFFAEDDQTFERVFALSTVESAVQQNLVIDTWIKVKVIEKRNEYKIVFEKDTRPDFVEEDETPFEIKDIDNSLLDSDIWG